MFTTATKVTTPVVAMPKACHIGICRCAPRSGLQISKKHNFSSVPTHKDSVLWGDSVTERFSARVRTSKPVSKDSVI